MITTIGPATAAERQRMLHELVAAHGKPLLAYVDAMLQDRHLAEDVVQETLLRAWRHIDRLYAREGSVRGWLLTVARNLAIDLRRSAAARHERVTAAEIDEARPDASDAVGRAEATTALLRHLSTEHRTVLFHIYIQDKTIRETARLLDVPVGTVKSRQHYALACLRARLSRPER